MSGDEKAKQIGNAVSECQTAKVELAHICQKLERVQAAYRDAGEKPNKSDPDLFRMRLISGKIRFGEGSVGSPSDLMNESEFTGLLLEYDTARKRVKGAVETLHSLGITDLK